MIRCRGIWGVVLALAFLPASAVAAPHVDGEFPVSKLSENNKIVAGPDGNVWVTLNDGTKDVARIDPKTGTVTEFNLGAAINEPQGITALGGFLWITEDEAIAKFDPLNPSEATPKIPIATIRNFSSIVAGPDGNLWVATNGALIRIPPGDPVGRKEFAVAGLSPRDIDVAGQLLVIADFANQRFLTATTDGTFTGHGVHTSVRGVAASPNGTIGFSQAAASPELGIFTPPGPPVFAPAPGVDPTGVAFGADGAFWAVEAFGTESATRFGASGPPTALSPGFAKDTHPRQIAAGPGNTLWVTLPGLGGGAGKVGRISGVENVTTEPPGKTGQEPQTQLGKGPRSKVMTRRARTAVKFQFSSPDAGSSFECRLMRIAKGSKAPRFAPCKSPKAYRLKPGRYRFEVRAVLKGVADKSPATRSFRVIRV